ncbi:MAG: hypothetical protein Q7S30_03360 [Candidatus Omnitrophota bacterium]|nr:hypothetical protein [Candidatus Omnitrophota bacterium]
MRIKSRNIVKDISFVILVSLALRILPILFGSPAASDMVFFRTHAVTILNNQNIYSVARGAFPYTPLSMFIPALCLLLSSSLSIPFHVVMKIPALMGDIALSIAIYYWIIRAKGDKSIAFKGAIAYAINPLVILISAFQGNMMSLPTLFTFLAVMMIVYDHDKNYRLSALLLGLAIAFRGYPVLLLPLILLKSELSVTKKIKYIAYAVIPTLITFIPFLWLDRRSVIREIFGYCGDNEYGYAAIERALSLYSYAYRHGFDLINGTAQIHLGYLAKAINSIPPNNFILQLLQHSKVIFLSVYVMILIQYKRFSLLKLALTTYLGFYFFYGGAASQYFIWIVPFFYFLDDRFSGWYIILGTYAVISVYMCYKPFTLFGRLPICSYPAMTKILLNEFIALFSFWSLCGIWFFTILFKKKRVAINDDI